MKKYFYESLIVILFLSSCRSNTKSNTVISNSTPKNNYAVKDTIEGKKISNASSTAASNAKDFLRIDSNTYSFSLGDDGTEGNEGMAYYEKGEIKKITFTEYGEVGQFRMTYSFLKNNCILLCEKDFSYPGGIDSISTAKDMHLDKDTCSSIDYDGNEIGSGKKDSISMGVGYLPEIKKIVPFKLVK